MLALCHLFSLGDYDFWFLVLSDKNSSYKHFVVLNTVPIGRDVEYCTNPLGAEHFLPVTL